MMRKYWTSIDLTSDDELVITMFNVLPDGTEGHAVEINYRRA